MDWFLVAIEAQSFGSESMGLRLWRIWENILLEIGRGLKLFGSVSFLPSKIMFLGGSGGGRCLSISARCWGEGYSGHQCIISSALFGAGICVSDPSLLLHVKLVPDSPGHPVLHWWFWGILAPFFSVPELLNWSLSLELGLVAPMSHILNSISGQLCCAGFANLCCIPSLKVCCFLLRFKCLGFDTWLCVACNWYAVFCHFHIES